MEKNDSQNKGKITLEEIDKEISSIKSELDLRYYNLGKAICDYADKATQEINEMVESIVALKRKRLEIMEQIKK